MCSATDPSSGGYVRIPETALANLHLEHVTSAIDMSIALPEQFEEAAQTAIRRIMRSLSPGFPGAYMRCLWRFWEVIRAGGSLVATTSALAIVPPAQASLKTFARGEPLRGFGS